MDGKDIGVNKLTVAYNRPLNLGNILSYRNIDKLTGPPVSSFAITDNEGHERERERDLVSEFISHQVGYFSLCIFA